MRKLVLEFVPGLLAGAVGGYVGYLAVGFIMQSGFWVPILPGAFAGLACGQVSDYPSRRRGVLNGVLALGLAIYAQWMLFNPPFDEHYTGTFTSYVTHLHQLPWLTLVILVLNGLLGFWWGREERTGGRRIKPTSPTDRLD